MHTYCPLVQILRKNMIICSLHKKLEFCIICTVNIQVTTHYYSYTLFFSQVIYMLLYFTFKLYMHMPTYIFHTRCLCHNFILFTILQFHYSSGFTWAYVHQIHVGHPFPILFNLMVDVF
jgi:hypothetical protein